MNVGKRVAIIGAGGIGFDTAEFLAHDPNHEATSQNKEAFFKEWGVDKDYEQPGALIYKKETPHNPREIYLLQRKSTKHGKTLGKTTGWIHRASLNDKGVEMIGGVQYKKIDDLGLHITVDGKDRCLEVDHVVVCAGQVSESELYNSLKDSLGKPCHLIGGAFIAEELDAKRAIKQGVDLAHEI
jgi:2,4-dienoyl-CoA reductase (NADPH2)